MFWNGFLNGCVNLQPIPHGYHFAKRNPGLGHTKRAGIHAEKNNTLGTAAIFAQIPFVRGPGVCQRIVNVGDGRRKTQTVNLRGKFAGGLG